MTRVEFMYEALMIVYIDAVKEDEENGDITLYNEEGDPYLTFHNRDRQTGRPRMTQGQFRDSVLALLHAMDAGYQMKAQHVARIELEP